MPPQYESTAHHVRRFVPMSVVSDFSSWMFVKIEDMVLAGVGILKHNTDYYRGRMFKTSVNQGCSSEAAPRVTPHVSRSLGTTRERCWQTFQHSAVGFNPVLVLPEKYYAAVDQPRIE
jgi:hypothetical protein